MLVLSDHKSSWMISTNSAHIRITDSVAIFEQGLLMLDPLMKSKSKSLPASSICPLLESDHTQLLYRWPGAALVVTVTTPPVRHPHKAGWMLPAGGTLGFSAKLPKSTPFLVRQTLVILSDNELDRMSYQARELVNRAKSLIEQ